MLHLTDRQVAGALRVPEALRVIEAAFLDLGRGAAANLARGRATAAGRTISAMGAAMPGQDVLGVKVYPTIDGRFNFVINLFSATSGALLAVLDGNALTELRTSATTLLAARLLAAPGARRLVLFGSGIQARAHARAFCEHGGIGEVTIVDPHGQPQALADELARELGVRARVEADAAQAVAQAQVVVTCTRSKTALFPAGCVQPGTFVAAIGSSKPDTRETDPLLMARAARIVVESRAQALVETGDLAGLPADGVTELGELVASADAFRRQPQDITVYKSVGIGLEDVAIAHAILRRHTGG